MGLNRAVVSLIGLVTICASVCFPQEQANKVEITSADGFILGARYYSAGARGPGILLLHQCNRESDSPLTGYEELALLLAERGFNVLELDFRGFWNSRNEEYSEFREQMDATAPKFPTDVEAAYRYLIAHEEVDAEMIGLAGASCGASQALFLAQNHESIKSLVFLSGSLWPGAKEAFESVKRLPIFIATSEDDRVTGRMSQLFSASEAPNSRLVLYKGELHGTPLFGLDETLKPTIVEWFRETLADAPECRP